MAETTNVAKMAEFISKEMFNGFFWKKTGPMNTNWDCEDSTHKKTTHPSDIVFYYHEPYSNVRTYVNCDLKSYSKKSIDTIDINLTMKNLAYSLSCAEKSHQFQERFFLNDKTAELCGLLFIYNHDGEYDNDFYKILNKIKIDELQIPQRSKIVVLGPIDIYWLNNIILHINNLRGQKKLPDESNCQFFYPHLVRKKNIQLDNAKAATLEMLTSPWIILSYKDENRKGFIIFYKRKGDTIEEFLYLIDYLLHYQILITENKIQIFHLFCVPESPAFFDKAKAQYIELYGGGQDIENKINGISFEKMRNIQTIFSEIEIGMKND